MIMWLISGLALFGTILNANRSKNGFILWLITNMYWTVVDFQNGLYAQSALFFAYTILAVKGLVTWSKKEKQETNNRIQS